MAAALSAHLAPDRPLALDSRVLAHLDRLALLARRRVPTGGQQHAERRSRQHGSSLEFADYRLYAPGDDLRRVDWNIAGRLDRLFLKVFEEERDLPVYLLLDASASMRWSADADGAGGNAGRPSKLDTARELAGALAYVGLGRLDPVGLGFFADGLGPELGAGRGRGHFRRVLEFLDRPPAVTTTAAARTDLRRSLRAFGSARARRRGLVFVCSDFFDEAGYEEAVDFLLYNRFEPRLIQVLDPLELDSALRGDFRLLDVETGTGGHSLDLTADDSLLAAYRRELERFQSGLREFCARRGVDFISVSTATPLTETILTMLRAGLLVR